MFTGREGGPIRRTAFMARHFRPAVSRAGLAPLRFHDLRHTAAALAIQAGAHPKAIAKRLGHASITTTLNQYGHLLPALDEQLTARLDELGRPFVGRDGNGMASRLTEQKPVESAT
jgi:integrase